MALTQVLLGIILYKYLPDRLLTHWNFALLIVATMMIAASGYIVNDIYDYPIDRINKPKKLIVSKLLTVRQSWWVYGIFVGLGAVDAVYLAYTIQDYKQLLIYPLAILMLWAYAKKFKKSFIAGNIVVALYCAFVPGILWYAERASYRLLAEKSGDQALFIRNVFLGYALMAFLTTAWREIIKDMEDLKGDKAYGSQSLPVKYGMPLAQKIASFLGLVVLGLMIYYGRFLWGAHRWAALSYLCLPIGLTIFTLFLPMKSLDVKVLHQTSQQIKWIMLLGLGYLYFLL